jgi:hypothetical protein
MSLKDFKESVQSLTADNEPSVHKTITPIKKNVLLSFVSDATGCGHIRNVFPLTYLNALFGKNADIIPIISPMFVFQEDILVRTKTILFQRQMSPEHYQIVLKYKEAQPRYGYKMVYDIDDFIWGRNELQGGSKEDGVPSYNFGWKGITDTIKYHSLEIIKLMDSVTVSSEYLKYHLSEVEGIKVPINVLHNSIPMYFWGNTRKKGKVNPIKTPRVLYTGSPTHYNNQDKLLGDFDNSYKDFIIKNVNAGKIQFTCMGDLPWFFEGIKDKITVIPWLNSYQYHLGVKGANADFAIGPLVRNNFNYSKSYIKYQEACAEGIPFVGSVFTNGKPSPYDVCKLKTPDTVTVEQIENIVFGLSNDVAAYNKIIADQYRWIDTTGGYLESAKYVQSLTANYF